MKYIFILQQQQKRRLNSIRNGIISIVVRVSFSLFLFHSRMPAPMSDDNDKILIDQLVTIIIWYELLL